MFQNIEDSRFLFHVERQLQLEQYKCILIDFKEFAYFPVCVIVHEKKADQPFGIVRNSLHELLHDLAAASVVLSPVHSFILIYAMPSGGIGSRFVTMSR